MFTKIGIRAWNEMCILAVVDNFDDELWKTTKLLSLSVLSTRFRSVQCKKSPVFRVNDAGKTDEHQRGHRRAG